ncbi:redoxin domain-containing protein [Pseudobacteriovorax antillogorgiicola]|uniref:thioredoxin-dependent peroxiredoxin n=1 Tax=Pseudobacteriovorax antillogorgiicola TaxID=1513793 RepID=A0A1Y6B9R4_9BACT|nr:redoxin domain-containing protein [Pseudobacteriovorax antillogorgiicola]TCS57500.1 peroxiredoxin [Pseudobacteriovorax antillogorgiicola]SMF00352.1 Peroxiredoxin [Pseudobacteriovorax antillogorgiicola]
MQALRRLFSIGLLLVSGSLLAQPGLSKGDMFPHFATKDINGQAVDTKQLVKDGPLVVLFYRGGWCPYCNRQLQAVNQEVLPVLKKTKGKIVAISVDKPAEGIKTKGNLKDDWHIVSDNGAKIVKTMKLEYKVPEDLVKTYKEKYQIDLEAASGKRHHIVPIPAVYVVGKDGKIVYAYANQDYKVRAANKEVNQALTALANAS